MTPRRRKDKELQRAVEWIDGRLRSEGTPIEVDVLKRVFDLERVYLLSKRTAMK